MAYRGNRMIVVLGCLALMMGYAIERTAGVDSRSRSPRPVVPKTKPVQPVQPVQEPAVPAPKETELGEDHEKNIKALQQEKLDVIRQRVALLKRAFSTGQITQRQLDQAMLEELRTQLEFLDQPHMRVLALEQIVTLLQRAEEEAKESMSTPGKPSAKGNDISQAATAHGRYVNARLARINAQISLERERLAVQQQGQGKSTTPSPTP